ncbi:MAG: AMP-binding protein [Alistipes sp.]|nr:AMP-binding protein [Alistipes sp.]MBQ1981303.1 AMP-binding protein [Alistipes sp.]
MKLKTIYELLHTSVEKFSNNIAFTMFGGEDVTYREVMERVEQVQEMLLSAGLKPGDKVALLSSSMPNWGVCYFAVTTAGMVVVPLMPDFTGEELDSLLEHSESKALLVSDKLYTKLSKDSVAKLNIVIRTKNLSIISQTVKEQGSKTIPQPEDLAAIIYTSGTTSKPKGVMLTHFNLASNASLCNILFPIREDDVTLSVLPMSHTYECTLGLLLIFSGGGRMTYLEKPPTPSVLLPALRKVRPTIFLIVPLIIEKVYNSQVKSKFTANKFISTLYGVGFIRRILHRIASKKLMKAFGGRIRFLGIGGSKLHIDTETFLHEGGFPYAIGYGLTETAPMAAGQIPGKCRIGATGPAMQGVQIRLDNVNPETGLGEVVINSPSVMQGYYKNPEATAEVFTKDGWFRSGDLGEFDKDGYLYIKGRLKNMIVGASGENIYPEDIESVLNTYAYVSESIVIEQDGHLVALVHYDSEAIERLKNEWMERWEISRDKFKEKEREWEEKMEEMKKDLMKYVNSKVNRFSRISEIIEEKEEFVKTPSKKIRRFLYERRGKDQDKK